MASKDLTYSVKIDASSAAAQAQQLRSVFTAQLQNIQINLLDPGALNRALSATQTIRNEYAQITQQAQQAGQHLSQINATQLQAQYDQIARDAQQAAQAMQQAATARPQAPQGPIGGGQTGGGLGDTLLKGAAGYLTIQGARQVEQSAENFATLGTQVRRTSQSFTILSGGAAQAESNLRAIKEASGGAVTNLNAMDLANQAISLHLANTAKGFGDVTRAAREIALVSPTIHDLGDALSQLGLFAANPQSFARADQLGLTATEVKDRMKELQAANAGLDDSQAKLQASMQLLDEKFGNLLKTEGAQVSGVEKLQVAFRDLWAEVAKGPAGVAVDKGFGAVGDVVEKLRASFGSTDPSALNGTLESLIRNAKEYQAIGFDKVPGFGSYIEKNISGFQDLQKALKAATDGVEAGIPSAENYRTEVENLIISAARFGALTDDDIAKLRQITAEYNVASKAVTGYSGALDNPAVANQQIDALRKTRQERLDKLVEPVNTLGDNLKGIGLDNFFNQLHDGLIKSAELTATENNNLATLRQSLVDIGRAVADSNGNITQAQRQQVEAINRQIDALVQASKLNEKLQENAAPKAPGQNLEAIYTRLNAIVAQTRGQFDETANAARALGDAIAQSGSASADQLAQIDQLAAQANQADFSRIAESLRELNSGSLDAIPGIDSLRDKLAGFYETLASGQGLTAAQAAEFAQLTAEADVLGGSTSALAALQDQLGYSFLNSHEYVAALVQQVANLEALYGSGAIGADQFAGGMNALTGELYSQLQAAGRLTPELARLLTMLNAVKAAASGGTFGPPAPGQFFGGFGGGGTVNTGSAGYLAGQAQAQAAAAAARVKADAAARAEAIKEQTKASKQAASGAQSAFEDAAKGTQKAFENVVDKLKSALEKVPGLFSPSKVTQEDIDASKAGVYQPKADEILRQVKSAAENPADRNRFAGQIQQIKDALNRIGVKPADDLKALAAQAEQAWSNQSLFSAKENLSLINKDAVKIQLDLAKKAEAGRQNIYEYFGATIDAVKEQFGKGDPGTVQAVAAELQGSQDKNLKALGKSLEDGINGAVEKTLKNLAAAEAGFSKGAGGGGGGGGSVSVGAIPTSSGGGTWIDTVSKNVGNAYQNFANLYAPGPGVTIPKTGTTGGIYGPPAPNKPAGVDTTGLAPTELTGKVKISEITLDPATVTAFENTLYNTFAAQTSRPADIGKGIAQVIGVSMSQADLSAPASAYMQALATAFGGATPSPKSLGEALDNAIQNGFIRAPRGSDMATGFVTALSASFGTYAPNYTAIGDTISYSIESAIANRTERLDMAGNFIIDLANQFGNADAITTYESTGSNISYLIESSIANRSDRLDMASGLIKDLTTQLGQQDYSTPVARFTGGLRTQFGADADQFNAIGQGVAQFIGLGITDYDLSGVGGTVIGNISGSFTGDAARTQLQGIGSAISGAIFQGFQSSIAYQPWLTTIVQEVVSQAMESMTNSVNDSLQTQAVGL